jgi:hypothetical protein
LIKIGNNFQNGVFRLTFKSCETKHPETDAIVDLSGERADTGVRGRSTMLPVGFQLVDACLTPMDGRDYNKQDHGNDL